MKKRITFAFVFLCLLSGAHGQSTPNISEMQKKLEEFQKMFFDNFDDTDLAEKGFKMDTSFFFKMDTTLSGTDFFNFSMPFGGEGMPNNMDEMFGGFGDISKLFKQFGLPGMESEDGLPKDDGTLREENEDELLPEEKLRQQEQKQDANKAPNPETNKKSTNKRKTVRL